MNVKLLRQVMASILEEPRRLNMDQWAKRVDPGLPDSPPCGTTHCIAGGVPFIMGRLKQDRYTSLMSVTNSPLSVKDFAQKELRLTNKQATRLFFFKTDWRLVGWPRRFSKAYAAAASAQERAEITAKRIEWFIKTKGLDTLKPRSGKASRS